MTIAPLAVPGITRYARPESEFEPIRRSFLRNAQMSLRAFRVLACVLSHAAGFVQTQQQIARSCGLSVTTVRAALDDLEREHYVARRVIREHGRVAGTAYAVSDQPFTGAELAKLCPPCTESVGRESVHTESTPRKKTTPARETMNSKKTNPSGGPAVADLARPSTEEDEPMPPTPPAPTLALEFAEQETKELVRTGDNSKRRPDTAATVVAAFVDSYRLNHSGGDPLKSAIGRVARDARQLLNSGRAGVPELVTAATAMGATPYANLGVQLDITRDKRPVARIAPVAPPGSFDAAHAASRAQFIADLKTDPSLAAWVADDPAEVAKLIQQDPELAGVFARVSAA